MLTLIRGATVYAPTHLGTQDVLIAGDKIIAIEKSINLSTSIAVSEVAAHDCLMIPGLVDSLVHISGGGGEAGFASRTPEMGVADAFLAGITTVVGALGTDDISRSHCDLVAKAKGLQQDGLNAFVHTGSYHVPVRTLGQSIRHDIMFINECIGVGEVAIADHRGSQPSVHELTRIAAEARTAGLLANKRGTVSVHVGAGKSRLAILYEVAKSSDIPLSQFYPTHMNRNSDLLMAGIEFASLGGVIDFTASTTAYDLAHGELAAAEALAYCLQKGVAPNLLTLSSDGHASLPIYDEHNQLVGFEVGSEMALFNALKQAITEFNVPVAEAVRAVTQNPADILGLAKGQLYAGADADLLLLRKDDFVLSDVWCRGNRVMQQTQLLQRGFFAGIGRLS
ncbi:beta-aspartyl-peptidase [Pseudoalteromonas fenneropenaei]|uniref:Isoaspartyl dipeptidase n=1 Tax=Pseudoalteromonas fenneropenaei TaxID=1737459 RepID=A0ABV7CLA7_9GAMM